LTLFYLQNHWYPLLKILSKDNEIDLFKKWPFLKVLKVLVDLVETKHVDISQAKELVAIMFRERYSDEQRNQILTALFHPSDQILLILRREDNEKKDTLMPGQLKL
jgi:hypothetical protein